MVIYYKEHVYLRPYVYFFCQIFQAQFIPCPTSIPEARVSKYLSSHFEESS